MALTATQVLAIPAPAADALDAGDDSLIIIETLELVDGTITIYGSNPTFSNVTEPSSTSRLARRCGSNAVSCDGGHVPALNTCTELVNRIRTSTLTLNGSPRSVCLSRSGKNCCISWSKDIGSVREADLFNAGKNVLDRCVGENNSGLARDVSINGNCLTECLSDRATGCK
ncbi:hypothetical protein B0T24DRAFT_571717 [Lasiosphaeria ovina]|uniref:WD-like domain-containing protein n=1 Tax=Lasiosphaeria ovina TaxID=92902 RepID=A0AAE0NFU1_9PEZI|nr:hypothetical protein B0T24DRAFT_571717 [Lasiosphaeria ovina]